MLLRMVRRRGDRMKLRELINLLEQYPDDMEVMTKKTEVLGNIGCVHSVKKDSYGFFGIDVPCILLSDEFEVVTE